MYVCGAQKEVKEVKEVKEEEEEKKSPIN